MVKLENVTKRFREHLAVDSFDLEVPEGALFGFIGPNGSGKTTTLRMILRIIEQDSGSISVMGEPHHSSANDAIGYLPEERGLYRKMTVLRQLMYFGNLKGLTNRAAKAAALEWLERLNLLEWKDKKLETLSKGMSQKIQFIATVLGKPRLLILDEPFSGLDPVNLEVLRDALLEMRKSGTTVIFSTHDMHIAEQLCDHICMIYKGQKVLDGSLESIQSKYGQDTLRLHFRSGTGLEEGQIPGASGVRYTGRFWEMRYAGDPHDALQAAMQVGRVDHFEVVHPSLHDIFVRIAQPADLPEEATIKQEVSDA
ncbi:ATP-binding cassette domain-containing protein [Puniceicoccales bacterium CK1056]|uniref:ATP-binding cassette domain-containing protein n=1 Tax=Oceanipulchritudo coccoides TaxID=2706888 RepID=A0A6B2M3U6_9BACT|nr:ATP-binding cassette domain-containing protein [Oceanipulchritudo coccoides]NDV62757.1 ATP-binding cassette domain-containing protein [Oceanipulchritudo coccoides]